jgi:hypothetical protein
MSLNATICSRLEIGKEKCKEEKLEQDKQSYLKFWNKEPIYKWLKKLRNRFDLKWL